MQPRGKNTWKKTAFFVVVRQQPQILKMQIFVNSCLDG